MCGLLLFEPPCTICLHLSTSTSFLHDLLHFCILSTFLYIDIHTGQQGFYDQETIGAKFTMKTPFISGIPFPLQKPVSWDPYKDSVRPCSVEIFVGVTPVFVVLRYFCRHFCLVQKRCSNCMNLEVGSPGKPRSFL